MCCVDQLVELNLDFTSFSHFDRDEKPFGFFFYISQEKEMSKGKRPILLCWKSFGSWKSFRYWKKCPFYQNFPKLCQTLSIKTRKSLKFVKLPEWIESISSNNYELEQNIDIFANFLKNWVFELLVRIQKRTQSV